MGQIRAQITTRSGPPGAKDTPVVVQGDWVLGGRVAPREFMERLRTCLEAAHGIASDGMVTEVAVLVFHDAFGIEGD